MYTTRLKKVGGSSRRAENAGTVDGQRSGYRTQK